jgi:hypothetical protein
MRQAGKPAFPFRHGDEGDFVGLNRPDVAAVDKNVELGTPNAE